LVPKFPGSHPAEAVGFLGRKKILSTPSFGGEVKPSVGPISYLYGMKKIAYMAWKSSFRQNYLTFLAHSSTFRRCVLSRGDKCEDAWWRTFEPLTKIAQ
jgi:hypothetical protein